MYEEGKVLPGILSIFLRLSRSENLKFRNDFIAFNLFFFENNFASVMTR